jgi:hypothetical protein
MADLEGVLKSLLTLTDPDQIMADLEGVLKSLLTSTDPDQIMADLEGSNNGGSRGSSEKFEK